MICLDFDGVLHSYVSGWTGPAPKDPPVEGAVEFVRALLSRGYNVVVASARCDTQRALAATKRWLKNHGFPELRVVCRKPSASLYIDDRGFRFEGDFSKVLAVIDDGAIFTPWTKRIKEGE